MPNLGVNVAVIQDGKVLLTKREDFEVWCLPGGRIEPGESVAQAAIRETREETGLDVELTRLVGVYSRLGFLGDMHAVLFAATPVGGELQTQPGETIEIGWFALDQIPDQTMAWQWQRIFDAMNGVGSGVAWRQNTRSSFTGQVNSRQELYELRDKSGLSRQAFFRQFIEDPEPEDDVLEVEDTSSS